MEDVKTLLMETADASKFRKTNYSKSKKIDQPWFDEECKDLKKEIMSCGKYLRTNPDVVRKREKLYVSKRKLRNLIRKNKTEYKKNIIDTMCSDLSMKEQKAYWNGLRKLEGRSDQNKYIPDYTLVSHFKELLFDDRISLDFKTEGSKKGSLDYPIVLEELKLATKILKNGKGTGVDRICNEMLVPLVSLHPNLVLRAFNDILEEHGVISQD